MTQEILSRVTIVGKPNVGKSTLFNRICKKRRAIESEISGTTRDRLEDIATWCGRDFILADTAGLITEKADFFKNEVNAIIADTIEESDLVVFLVDINQVINDVDRELAKIVHKSGKKVVLVANKVDNNEREEARKELFSLGFGQPCFVSAISGRNVGDMLDLITNNLPKTTRKVRKTAEATLAIVGRPNVGKSTLINALTNKNVSLTSEIPGTTRDIVESEIELSGKKIKIVDTAGIRRRGKIEKGIEKYSVMRAMKAIDEAEVVIILVNAEEGLVAGDVHLAGYAKENGKSIIIAVNKIDIWNELTDEEKELEKSKMIAVLQSDLAFIPYVPVVFISALDKENLTPLLKNVIKVRSKRFTKIEPEELKEIYKNARERLGQLPDIYDIYQDNINPIVIKIVVKNKKVFHFSFARFLENFIRDQIDLTGTPIFIDLIEKNKK